MAEQSTSQPNNQLTSVTVTVGTDEADAQVQQDVATVRLKLRKPKTDKKVNWTAGTVDNEDMNKKKSKCCCIYQKPRAPDESSSSDDDDECEHCHGHVEKKKKPTADNESPASSEPPAQSMIAA